MPPSTSLANKIYVRARYYRPDLTRWQTLDPLWPNQPAYEYCDGSPTLESDPSGKLGQGAIGAIAGCLLGGVFGFIGGLLGGLSAGQAGCKAAISCVAGAIIGAISTEFPWWAKCIGSAIAGLAASLSSILCNPTPACPKKAPPWPCLLISALVSLAVGCVTTALGNELQKWLLGLINGAFGSSVGSICSDIERGRSGGWYYFPPQAQAL